jgi:hypothetical protein
MMSTTIAPANNSMPTPALATRIVTFEFLARLRTLEAVLRVRPGIVATAVG